MLSLTDIEYTHGTQTLLDDVCLAAEPGDCVGILSDDNLAQKALIQIMAGLLLPTSGTALFDGHPLFDGPRAVKRQIGWFGLPDAHFPRLTVRENLTFFARLYNLSADEIDQRLDFLTGLLPQSTDILDQLPNDLSTGQRELACFLRSILPEPRLLLVDHAFQRLGEHDLAPVCTYLKQSVAENHTIVLFSPRWSDLINLCTDIMELKDGRLQPCEAPGARTLKIAQAR